MSAIEDELRRIFADPGRTPPAWPDATTRVRAGMRRRHRRRAVTGAGGATMAVLIVVAVLIGLGRTPAPAPPTTSSPSTSLSPSSSGSADAIPWRDLPYVAYPRALPSPRPDGPACRAANLVLDSDDTLGAAGTATEFVKVHNGGSARCTLSGRPTLLHTVAGAAVVGPTNPIDEPDAGNGITPATIDPGEQAVLMIETYGGCTAPPTGVVYANLALRLTGGTVLALGSTLDPRCGVGMGQWYRPVVDTTDHLPWLGLTAAIEAPQTVHLGRTFDYVVTLTNPTGLAVPLAPCPNYVEGIAGATSGGVNQLNCTVASIPAGGQVRFAMRLSWTAGVGLLGPGTLSWTLDAGNSTDPAPTASTTVIVQR
jgi:hypothetical protein